MSSTVERMEKSKTSVCREPMSKTRSKVKAPAASLDCEGCCQRATLEWKQHGSSAYVDLACVLTVKVDHALAVRDLCLVWWPKTRNNCRQIVQVSLLLPTTHVTVAHPLLCCNSQSCRQSWAMISNWLAHVGVTDADTHAMMSFFSKT